MNQQDDYLIGFGGAVTGLLAIAIAVLTFFAQRAVARKRVGDPVYESHLLGIALTGLYALACDVLAWWSWCEAAGRPEEWLFEWPASVWISVLFGPPAVFAAGSVIWAGRELGVRRWRAIKGRWPA